LMRARGVGCLPVVEGGSLVGIVTAKDFLDASAKLFEERLTSKGGRVAAAAGPEAPVATGGATPSPEDLNKALNSNARKT
jgi:CBS domain-containing protein